MQCKANTAHRDENRQCGWYETAPIACIRHIRLPEWQWIEPHSSQHIGSSRVFTALPSLVSSFANRHLNAVLLGLPDRCLRDDMAEMTQTCFVSVSLQRKYGVGMRCSTRRTT